MNKFSGTGVAMVTPFNKDFSIDIEALKTFTEHLVSNNVSYLVVMGTTGENPTLGHTEQQLALDAIAEVNAKRKPIVFGIAGNNTNEVLRKFEAYNLDAVDGILTASPYYNKPNQEGLLNHYTKLADATPKPIILYNVPGRTGSNMGAEAILKLAEHQNVVGVKEASGDINQCMEIIKNAPEDFQILSGDDDLTLPYISLGMHGVISVVANAYPKEFSQMVHFALDSDFKNARYMHYKLLPAIRAMFADGNPGGVKYFLHKMGLMENVLREPLAPINDLVTAQIDAIMQ